MGNKSLLPTTWTLPSTFLDLWNDDYLFPDIFKGFLSDSRSNLDVKETDDSYLIRGEFPGVSKDDIKVFIEDDTLTISYEEEKEDKKKSDEWRIFERSSKSFKRSFRLPQNVAREDIQADMDSGILKLKIPKKEDRKPQRKQIAIK